MQGVLFAVVALVLAGPAAQDTGTPTQVPPVVPPAPQSSPARDPFVPSDTLRRLLQGTPTDGFVPLERRPSLPPMKMRGLLKMKKHEQAAAAVQVEGIGTYVARAGEKIVFSQNGSVATAPPKAGSPPTVVATTVPIVLKVLAVSSEGVVVELGTLGQTLVIR